MKIALITARVDPFISPQDMNGGCVLVRNYIKALHKLGHDIHVFTRLNEELPTNSERDNKKAYLQKEAGIGKIKANKRLTIYRLPYKPYSQKTWQQQMEESASFLKYVKPYFDKENFDVYHYFHLLSLAGWELLLGEVPDLEKTTFSPLLLTIGREFEFPAQERIDFEKKTIQSMPAISCQSIGELNMVRDAYNIPEGKLVRIPLGVDTEIFYTKEKVNQTLDNERTILISPNTIKHQKQQLKVINIAKMLKDSGKNIITVFMGRIREPEYVSEMRELIKKSEMTLTNTEKIPNRQELMEIDTDFIYIPGKSEKALSDLIRSGDIAIFPSTDEGFGLLNLDCMACGTLPVCTHLKAYGDYLLPGENALVVNKEAGLEGFVEAVGKLLDNKEDLITLSKIAANSAQNFSWDTLIKKQLFVYNTLFDNDEIESTKYHEQNWINLND